MRLIGIVQALLPVAAQVLRAQLAGLFDQGMQRRQTSSYQKCTGCGDQQRAADGSDTEDPGQLAQQRIVRAAVQHQQHLHSLPRRLCLNSGQINDKAAAFAALVIYGLAQLLE